eukprot:8371122-Ditylum_brightwellii.AAC.1
MASSFYCFVMCQTKGAFSTGTFDCGWCISAIFGYGTFSCSSTDDSNISVTNLNNDHFGLELDNNAATDHKNNNT